MDADFRLVLVHDWLTGMRGGEKCLEVLCRRFPRARLFHVLHRRGSVCDAIERLQAQGSFLDYLPQVHRYYRYLLPLMPLAARWRLPACDVVVSLSHCVAKAARPPRGVPHVCYCFTPMRYAWHQRQDYEGGRLRRWLLDRLQTWDRRTADRVTHFVAISKTVQQRIRACYGRASRVIYPPVDTDFFRPAHLPREDYYLVVSALVPYKRIDLAIEACNQLQRPLVVLGTGPEEGRLKALAGPTVHFRGWQPDAVVRDQMRRCRALLFPGEEDFGLVPVEAMACGTPVLALGRGGASESVVPLHSFAAEPTGVWFENQTVEDLIDGLKILEKNDQDLDPRTARRRALRFATRRFEEEFLGYLHEVLDKNKHPVEGQVCSAVFSPLCEDKRAEAPTTNP